MTSIKSYCVLVLMLLVSSVPVYCDSEPTAEEHENNKRIHKAIRPCTIPELDLRQKTVGEAVQFFNHTLGELTKDKEPLKVYINYEGMPEDVRKNFLQTKPFSKMEVKRQISFLEGITFLCKYTRLVARFKADGIELRYLPD